MSECKTCIANMNKQENANNFIDFLKYSGIDNCDLHYNNDEESYEIFVTPEDETKGIKLLKAFWESNDSSNPSTETSSPIDLSYQNGMPSSSTTYVKKEDHYKDLKSTFWVFLIFGIGGVIFTIINITGILTLLNNWLQYIVMGAFSVGFIVVAIRSNIAAKQTFLEIDTETETTASIKKWLDQHISKEQLQSFDETSSPEAAYLEKLDFMKQNIKKNFTINDDNYLDELLEEYYEEHFD